MKTFSIRRAKQKTSEQCLLVLSPKNFKTNKDERFISRNV